MLFWETNWQYNNTYDLTTDLQRVENNISELSDNFNAIGFLNVISKKVWTVDDLLTVAEFNRIKQNVLNINNTISAYNLPCLSVSENVKFDCDIINSLEKSLKDIEKHYEYVKNNLITCGTFNAGAVRQIQKIRSV